MGQEVKNVVRAQSKYSLMGSSAKTGKKIFRGSQQQFLDKTVIWDRTPPPAIHQIQCICVGDGSRVPNLQTEFNYLDSFKRKAFLVILLSPWSPCCPRRPCRPHIIPVSSPSSPHHPHSPQKVPMWSQWLWSQWSPLSPPHVVPMLSLWSPCRPHHPRVIPVIPTSSP